MFNVHSQSVSLTQQVVSSTDWVALFVLSFITSHTAGASKEPAPECLKGQTTPKSTKTGNTGLQDIMACVLEQALAHTSNGLPRPETKEDYLMLV